MGYIGNYPTAGSFTGGDITDGSIETQDLKNGAVTPAKMSFATETASSLLFLDASKVIKANGILSFDGTVLSLPNSDANSLLYLNGTKGIASSTNLAFDGTDLSFPTKSANSLVYLDGNKKVSTNANIVISGNYLGVGKTDPGSEVDIKGALRLSGATSGFVGLAPAANAGNITFTLPASDGLNGQVLSTNGTGSLQWINQSAGGSSPLGSGSSTVRTAFTATEGQTSFNVNYVVGQIDVYLNGVKLVIGTDVTATTGTTIVLAVAAKAGDIVDTVVFSTQWNLNGVNLYYNLGSVGIGTDSPNALLSLGATVASRRLLVYDGGTNSTYAGFGTPGSNNLDVFTFAGGTVRLGEWSSGGSFTERANLNNIGLELKGKLAVGYSDFTNIPTNGAAFAGSVGIGTSSPFASVHAMSAASTLSFALSPSSSNTNIGYITNDSTYIMFASGYGSTGQKFRVALSAPDNSATLDSFGNFFVPQRVKLGFLVAQGAPSTTDITTTAHTLLGGTGGNYLAVGQYGGTQAFAQWIQSTYENPTTAKYNLVLQPLGGNVVIGASTDIGKRFHVDSGISVGGSAFPVSPSWSAVDFAFDGATNTGFISAVNPSSSELAFGTKLGSGVEIQEAARFKANGNFVIGATGSTNSKFSSYGGSKFSADFWVNGEAYNLQSSARGSIYEVSGTAVRIVSTADNVNNTTALINFNAYNSTGGATGAFFGALADNAGNGPAHLVFGRRTGTTAWAESARITSSGNTLLNQTQDDGWKLQINGVATQIRWNYVRETYSEIFGFAGHNGDSGGVEIGNINASTDRSIRFSNGSSYAQRNERIRINNGGYFAATSVGDFIAVGAFSPANLAQQSYNSFFSNTNDRVLAILNKNAGSSAGAVTTQVLAGARYHLQGYLDNTEVIVIGANGNIQNTNNSYGALSDLKLKQDISLAPSQWDDIKNLIVKKFRLKSNPTGPLLIGLIADDAINTSPGLVEESEDFDVNGTPLGTTTKSVKYSVLYMKAVKALQEAMLRIETLEARMAQVEAKL